MKRTHDKCPHCQEMVGRQGWGSHKRRCDVTWDELFRSRINTEGAGGCGLWTDYTNNMGYGATRSFDGTPMVAVHRLMYQFAYGNIKATEWVLHKCDVPRCCNPSHLFLGNDMDNMNDMWAKDRHMGRLKAPQVREVREALRNYRLGLCAELAKKYGVSRSVISDIKMGSTYKRIT